jgi:hypothetical protein
MFQEQTNRKNQLFRKMFVFFILIRQYHNTVEAWKGFQRYKIIQLASTSRNWPNPVKWMTDDFKGAVSRKNRIGYYILAWEQQITNFFTDVLKKLSYKKAWRFALSPLIWTK